jgi:transposase
MRCPKPIKMEKTNMAKKNLSSFESFVETSGNHPIHIGVDVHKNSYHLALRRYDGAQATLVMDADPERVIALLQRRHLTIALLAYEAGPTGFALARALQAAGIPVCVVAPSRVPRPVTAAAKTDRLDCLRLAEYAAKGLLRSIAIPTQQEEADRTLIRRHTALTDAVRRIKQRIRSLLLEFGVKEPTGLANWSKRTIDALQELALPDSLRFTLDSQLQELRFLQTMKNNVRTQLLSLQKADAHREIISCLQSVPGVGPVVAAAFSLEIYSPQRFQRAEELTSYLGLAPMVRQSGETKGNARLRPVGQTRLRSLLTEAAWVWIRNDAYASDKYRKILSRCGIFQKALVAMARRLAVILWRLSLEKRPYQSRPLPA